jgi:hypothetical protein
VRRAARPAALRLVLGGAVVWSIVPLHLPAQTASSDRATDAGLPASLLKWSPLISLADLPRELPRAPALAGAGFAPPPHVGAFWDAGNPAALVEALGPDYTDLRITGGHEGGAFRRPLDAGTVDARQFTAMAWRSASNRNAAIGRALIERESVQDASNADFAQPFASNPFELVDTTSPPMTRVRATLDGALGYRRGTWGAGLSVGYDARDHHTDQVRFPRRGLLSTVGATAGIARAVPLLGNGTRIGAHLRWQGATETVTLNPVPGVSAAYALAGYDEPDLIVIAQPPAYYRRAARDGHAAGLSAEGVGFGAHWVVGAERGRATEGQWSVKRANPPTDSWRADVWNAFATAQSRVDRRALLTAGVRYQTLRGQAQRSDIAGVFFRTTENRLSFRGDARLAARDSAWTATFATTVAREGRLRTDYLVPVASRITTWQPGGSIEVLVALDPSVALSLGASAARTWSDATLPRPSSMGPLYGRYIAPELALYATPAFASAISLGIRRPGAGGSSMLARITRERLRPLGSSTPVPGAPGGERTLWTFSAGWARF